MKFWDYIKEHKWTVLLGVLVLALAAYAIFTVVREKDDDQANAVPRDEIVDQFAPHNEPVANPIDDIRGEPNVLGEETSTPPATTPPPTTTTPPLAPTVTFKPYRNDALGFSASVPSDAVFKETATEVRAGASNQAGLYWTVTVYPNTTETLASIESQMRSSPDLHSLAHITLDGKPALQFTSPNLNGATGYALINNGRLYYIVGNFVYPEMLTSFKFF